MASIFPIYPQGTNTGTNFTVGTTTYQWTGYAWIKVSETSELENLTLKNLTATNSIVVTSSTNAISTVTGAFQVVGGAGFGKDVWIGGALYVSDTSTINNAIIITTATLAQYITPPIFIAGTGTAITTSTVGSLQTVTIWNTATLQTVTDNGNSTTNAIYISNNTTATGVGTGALIVDGGVSIGQDLWLGGTIYSAGIPVITTSTLVDSFIAGPDISVTATQGLITGTVSIIISNTSTLQSVTGRGSSTNHVVYFTNTTSSTSSSTGAVIVTGGLGVGGRINSESVQIADAIMDSSKILVNTTATIVVDAYSVDDYRSAKYLIQIQEGTGPGAQFETIEILLMVDNAQTIYATEYAVLSSNGELGEFAADVQGDDIARLYFTPYYNSTMTLQIFRTTMRA
jgi:hypothetical protein